MKTAALEIPIPNLILSFLPVVLVFLIFLKWKLDWKGFVWANARMLGQLILIGYFLSLIFGQHNPFVSAAIIFFMLSISAWISLNAIKENRKEHYLKSLLALALGAIPVMILVTGFVVPTTSTWYAPSFLIPLAGMIFSNSMNTIALAAERINHELANGTEPIQARKVAFSTALIPQLNAFLAVGLVALPGMMTGQILAGTDPLIAARYQIVVMTMVMGAGGLAAAIYIQLKIRSHFNA